jgi:hypothetical protein
LLSLSTASAADGGAYLQHIELRNCTMPKLINHLGVACQLQQNNSNRHDLYDRHRYVASILINATRGAVVIDSCSFTYNQGFDNAILITNSSDVLISNSLFNYNNYTDGAIGIRYQSNVRVSHCSFAGNRGRILLPLASCISIWKNDPQLTNERKLLGLARDLVELAFSPDHQGPSALALLQAMFNTSRAERAGRQDPTSHVVVEHSQFYGEQFDFDQLLYDASRAIFVGDDHPTNLTIHACLFQQFNVRWRFFSTFSNVCERERQKRERLCVGG